MQGPALDWISSHRVLLRLGAGLWILFVFSVMAYWLDFVRLYLIGAAYAMAFAGAGLLDAPIVFLVAGGVVLFPGLFLLVRFIRKYPVPGRSELHADR